ncbi:MAG: NAD-dependent epimerase/dehydratase family protein [bacterium]
MRALVTGANGFIGSHLCRELLRRGQQVRGFVQPGTSTAPLRGLDLELHTGDVRSRQALRQACIGQELLFHLAAIPSDWAPAALIHEVNVEGTRNLVAGALAAGSRRLVLMSSLAVHASTGHRNATEDTQRDRNDLPYAVSKRLAEDIVLDPRLHGRLEGVVIRPGLVPFGPGDQLTSLNLARALGSGRLPLINGGRAAICTSYVENLVPGVALAGQRSEAAYETLVLADDGAPTWADLFGSLARELGAPPPPFSLPWSVTQVAATALEGAFHLLSIQASPPITRYRVGLWRHDFHFTSARAKRVLGYRPTIGLDEGVRRTIGWARPLLSQ